MLGVVPQYRKSAFHVLACAAWNLTLLTPFTIAFWVLTEVNIDSGRQCFGLPWDVANFARWTFLGCAIYQIFAAPLNICLIRREEKQKGWIIHEWMRMFDALHWLMNWALFFYLVAALVNRHECPNGNIRGLIWATVWVSVAFAIAGILAAVSAISILIFKNIEEIGKEAHVRTEQGIGMMATRVNQNDRLKQAVGMGAGVEVLDIRRSQVVGEDAYVREAERKRDEERRRVDLESQGVHDKVHREYVHDQMIKDEVPITRSRREQNEPVNFRDDVVVRETRVREEFAAERTDYQEPTAVENRHIRNLDPRGGKF